MEEANDLAFADYYDFNPDDFDLSNGWWKPLIAGGTSY